MNDAPDYWGASVKFEKLYVTNAECAERIGISTDDFNAIEFELNRQGFPPKDPLFNNRRYWPAVRAFLDRRNGVGDKRHVFGPPDGKERWK
ncbi:winged helix-turn-helix domain-containing protein [Rhizobium mongolense]